MVAITLPLFSIDTLHFSKRMQKVGMQKEISEELAEAIKDASSQALEGVATKQDIFLLKQDISLLKKDIELLDQKIDHKTNSLDQKIDALENKLTIKIFAMLTVAVGLITWLDRLS
jgi:hypothetical protein